MKKVLISAYACEPNVGSEPGVGWYWVKKAAASHEEVHVVTRTGDRQIDADGRKYVRPSQRNIEDEMNRTDLPGQVIFHYFDLPTFISRFERTTVGDIVNIYLWEIFVFFFLFKKFPRRGFDLVQKVTIVSHRYPSFAWFFGKKYVHGPIAGGERFPLSLMGIFSAKSRLKEYVRMLFQHTPSLDPLIWWTYHKADEILVVTEETKTILPLPFQKKCTVKQAISEEEFGWKKKELRLSERQENAPLRLLYVGRLLEWKGIMLALQALKKVEVAYEFDVIGDGPARSLLDQYARSHELSVNFLGFIPRNELPAYYQKSELFLFPSLRDSGGFVVLEAQANGLPVLALNLGGPAINLDQKSGILIPVKGRSLDQIITQIVREIGAFHDRLTKPTTNSHLTND